MTKKVVKSTIIISVLCIGVLITAHAQTDFGGPWGRPTRLEVVSRFDQDEDGRLDGQERQRARSYVRESRGSQPLTTRSSSNMPVRASLLSDLQKSAASAPRGKSDLYDETILRTLYLRFSSTDWIEELSDFFNTDVEVPADLIVDGKVYPGVGVHFRGSSSYFMTRSSKKNPSIFP